MNKKILLTIPIIAAAIIGSLFLYSQNNKETSASVSRTGLTLDLDFGNNDGSATPTVYDSSGFARHATSTAGATSPTCNQHRCDFTPSTDNMTANATNVFNSSNISFAIKFTPDFAADDGGGDNYLFDAVAGTGEMYRIGRTNNALNNVLRIHLGNSQLTDTQTSAYAQYWKSEQENVLVVIGTTGNNKIYLNGNLVASPATSWTLDNPTAITLGNIYSKNAGFDGRIHYLKVWNRLLTDQEVAILSADRETTANTAQRSGATGSSTGTLVGYWNMDVNDMSSTGATMYDKSGYGNNGTVTGTTTSTGKIAQARTFNGTSDSIDTISPITAGADFTVTIWFKTGIPIEEDRILNINGRTDMNRGFSLYMLTTGEVRCVKEGLVNCTGESFVSDDEWHFIVLKRTGDTINTYLDGSSTSFSTNGTAGTEESTNLSIGSLRNNSNYIDGSIDDVRIYNYALSAQEIANLYSSAKVNYSTTIPRNGLVGYWNMDADDINNTTIYDKSGNGNHGTRTGATGSNNTPQTIAGKINQALDFDGTDDNITLTNYSTGDTISFGVWIKTTSADAIFVLDNQNAATLNAGINIYTYTYPICRFDDGTAQITTQDATLNIIDGKWHHVFCTKDASDNKKIYVDGVLEGTNATAMNDISSSDDLYIGSYTGGAGSSFDGQIDEVMIWDRALSAAEVAQVYNYTRSYVR